MRTTRWGISEWIGNHTRAGKLRFNVRSSATNRPVFSSLPCWAPNRFPILINARQGVKNYWTVKIMILFSQFSTFNEFQLWQEARSETIACRLAGELCTIRVKTSAAVVKGSSRVKIADTVFSTTTRWCTPVTQLHHNSCITSRSLVRPFGDLTIKPKLNEFQTSNEKKKKTILGVAVRVCSLN